MSRSSRFTRLETEREPTPDSTPASGASLERFAPEPDLAPHPDPADPMAPLPGSQRLQRFEEDGAQGLGLDRDPLAALAMLQCPSCGIDCGKFETRCHGCTGSLTTPLAREHNLLRVEALKAELEVALESDRERREQALHEGELLAQQTKAAERGMALELHDKFSGKSIVRNKVALLVWGAMAFALLVGVVARGIGPKILALTGFTLLLLTRIPPDLWRKLLQKARRRDRG